MKVYEELNQIITKNKMDLKELARKSKIENQEVLQQKLNGEIPFSYGEVIDLLTCCDYSIKDITTFYEKHKSELKK